jgi:hypothetical protein
MPINRIICVTRMNITLKSDELQSNKGQHKVRLSNLIFFYSAFHEFGKLNFLMVVSFKAQAKLQWCRSCVKMLNLKVVKIDPKIIISLC